MKYSLSKKIYLLFLLVFINPIYSQQAVKVETKYGALEGVNDKEKGIALFLGVPFAEPPVRELRWKAPRPPKKWQGVKPAKEFAPAAVQTNVFGDMIYRGKGTSEDCLYLNIWTPEAHKNKAFPVLVYFYGGGFVAGDGSEPRYDGASMAQNGIVTVTVNYRLNVFGFLAHPELTEEATYGASGNYGLLDQNAALKWVYENIEEFGGDPEKITIAGESAGSISVSAHMASPLSRDFLAGAIGESGASIRPTLAPVPLAEAEKTGKQFAENIGYPSLRELRSLSTDEIFELYNESGRFGFPTVIDSYFLPKSLPEIFKNGDQAQIPLLVGWNSAEMPGNSLMQGEEFSESNYKKKIKELYPESFERVLELYPANEIRSSATALASDRFIVYSTWKWADLHANNSDQPVYRYIFSRIRPSAKEEPLYRPEGAAHASEIEYFMGNLGLMDNPNLTEEDFQISETIQKYLVNFIKTGNPNSEDLLKWPSLRESNDIPSVMIMDSEFKVIQSQQEDRYEFHDEFYGNN